MDQGREYNLIRRAAKVPTTTGGAIFGYGFLDWWPPNACGLRVSQRTDRRERQRTNLRSVPGFGLNARLQQFKTYVWNS